MLPLVCSATAAELIRVLAYAKFRLSNDDRDELLADHLPMAEVVTVPNPLRAVPHCRDPHDLPFLHLAAAGRAAALIERESARRLARLGGSQPALKAAPRRRAGAKV